MSNGFSIVYIFLSILTGLLFCYLLLPDSSPLLAMETPRVEGDRQNLVEAWDNGRLVEVPYTLPERNIDLSTPKISYYANPLSLRWPLSGYSVPLYPTDTTTLSASSRLVPLLHLVETPLTAVSVLPELIYNEG